MPGRVFIANRTATVDVDGVPTIIHRGMTKVREGHALLSTHAELFNPDDSLVHFEVENATAAPGEKRGKRDFQDAVGGQSDSVKQKDQAPKSGEVPMAQQPRDDAKPRQTRGLRKDSLND
jgi:hypothetical protein